MTDLVMPKLGLTMTEGLLTEWHVAPGAAFREGDVLFTVETEKVASDVEAQADGVLAEILVPEGETVAVGRPVARLVGGAGAGEAAPRTLPAGIPETPPAQAHTPEPGGGGHEVARLAPRLRATPLARRIAAQQGVDLRALSGSGPRGRIKARDVARAAQAPAPAPAPDMRAAAGAPDAPMPAATRIALDPVRLAVARRVSAAKRDIPHFHVTHEAEVSALMALRAELNADAPPALRISVTHMLIRALGLALSARPAMNRIWAGDHILALCEANVGMVTQTPDGLRVPVIRDAGRAPLDEIAAQARALAERARSGALGPGDVGDGVIAVSNLGMMGVSSLTPIINPPNAMILGVGAERQLFRPDASGAPALRRELTLTLACDHRIIDGADAARFLAELVAILETPLRLLRPARCAGAPSAGD